MCSDGGQGRDLCSSNSSVKCIRLAIVNTLPTGFVATEAVSYVVVFTAEACLQQTSLFLY